MFSQEISGVGSGSCTIDLDAEFMQYGSTYRSIIEYPYVWEFYQNNVLRSDWISSNLDIKYVDQSLTRELVVSGRGLADVLRHGVVLPPKVNQKWIGDANMTDLSGFRGGRIYTYGERPMVEGWPTLPEDFIPITPMENWRKHFSRVRQRFADDPNTLHSVLMDINTSTFSSSSDSEGFAWDSYTGDEKKQLPADGSGSTKGTNMYDLLVEMTRIEQADFYMEPGAKLKVCKEYGTDRSARVIFNNPVLLSKSRQRDRSDIANSIYVENNLNHVNDIPGIPPPTDSYFPPGVVDIKSRKQWARRERYIELEVSDQNSDNPTSESSSSRAYSELARYKDELSSWDVSVPAGVELEPGLVVNRPFIDYGIGDYIGLTSEGPVGQISSVEKLRVMAISGAVDSNGDLTVELTLETNLQLLRELQTSTR
jgi:hypothetical protein